MNKNKFNNVEIVEILRSIKIILYLILTVLIVNTVLLSVNFNSGSIDNDNNNVKEEIPEYDVSKYNSINYADFKEIISLKGTHVIYIGRSSCSYCALFIPIMNEAQEKYGFTTNYFDISSIFNFSSNTVIDEVAFEYMSNINDFFKENFLATPMVVIFKDGKYVDGTLGYQELSEYSTFLENNGFKKK